jgi:hypothetical protein
LNKIFLGVQPFQFIAQGKWFSMNEATPEFERSQSI